PAGEGRLAGPPEELECRLLGRPSPPGGRRAAPALAGELARQQRPAALQPGADPRDLRLRLTAHPFAPPAAARQLAAIAVEAIVPVGEPGGGDRGRFVRPVLVQPALAQW